MQKKYISNASSFFENNTEFYGNIKPLSYDDYFLNYIKANQKQNTSLLDIGGGSGIFAKLVKHSLDGIEVTVIDPSKNLLNKIDDSSIIKIQGSLPSQISLTKSFDFIHVKEVFHHRFFGKNVKGIIRRIFIYNKEALK